MRDTLITRFICAGCGSKLRLVNASEAKKKVNDVSLWDREDPTGGTVSYNKIIIAPCSGCVERLTGPARQLASSLKAITAAEQHE